MNTRLTDARLFKSLTAALAASAAALACGAATAAVKLDQLKLPAGFRIELVTEGVPNARQMALGRWQGDAGVVYVGSMRAGKVYAVQIAPGRPAVVHTIASGLEMPSGVAWREGKLYVPVGAPCNVCVPDDRHGVIQRMNADGSGLETVARGVRNSVGFDWSPADKSLWFTDNGRDMMGDEVPNDELNRVTQPGQSFGFPYCHQGDVPDPEFGKQRACSEFAAPAAKLGPHVAAIGMRFYTGSQFPAAYRGNAFIAEHGSWNRSAKSGYQVVRVAVDAQGKAGAPEPFVQGFLQVSADGRETVWGRPADVLNLPDGSLLVSDDLAGAIYRVRYTGN